MANDDVFNAILIISIFTILISSISLSINIEEIKNNWDNYKCNPIIIPVAGIINPEINSVENFNSCVSGIISDFMGDFIQPFIFIINFLKQLGLGFIQIFSYLKKILNMFGIDINKLFNIFNTNILNMLTEFKNTITNFTDILNNLVESLGNVQDTYIEVLDDLKSQADYYLPLILDNEDLR